MLLLFLIMDVDPPKEEEFKEVFSEWADIQVQFAVFAAGKVKSCI